MFKSSKAARPRTKLKKHNIQDIRVTSKCTGSAFKKSSNEKQKSLMNAIESFLVRQALIEIWSNRHIYWEDICELAGMLLRSMPL